MFNLTTKTNIKIHDKKLIISPEDLLPKYVENSNGEVKKFDAQKIYLSVCKETGLDQSKSHRITIDMLRKLSGLNIGNTISAPNIREMICSGLTNSNLQSYRNKYTRLGIPLFDITELLNEKRSTDFMKLWIVTQVMEQYIHLNKLHDNALNFLNTLRLEAIGILLLDEEEEIILESIDKSLNLLNKKTKGEPLIDKI